MSRIPPVVRAFCDRKPEAGEGRLRLNMQHSPIVAIGGKGGTEGCDPAGGLGRMLLEGVVVHQEVPSGASQVRRLKLREARLVTGIRYEIGKIDQTIRY